MSTVQHRVHQPMTAPSMRGIPWSRITATELRKMLDTRSGFWTMASIAFASMATTGMVILFADREDLTYRTFTAAISVPMSLILPIIAILSVTAEWSQRSGLTTFTLVPRRGRVLGAKVLAAIAVGVVAMFIALVVGVLGTLVGSMITGLDPVWNATVSEFALIVLGSVLGMLFGFMLGVLVRNSAGAIVAYFVYTLVLPPLLGLLAANQEWFKDLQPWVDLPFAQTALFEGMKTGSDWAHIATSFALWIVLPGYFGLRRVMRSEVK